MRTIAFASLFVLLICALAQASLNIKESKNADGYIVGLSSRVELVKVSPDTGALTPISGPLGLIQGEELSSLDAKNGILYFIGFNTTSRHVQLTGVDVRKGGIVRSINLPFAESMFVGLGQTCDVDPTNGDVLVSGPNSAGLHDIYRVTPSTGEMKKLNSVDGVNVLGGSHVYDPKNNILWLQFGLKTKPVIDLYGFDGHTGKLVHQFDNNLNLETMTFDPKTGLIYGVGLKVAGNFTRVLLSLDSAAAETKIVGEIPGYFMIEGSIGTLDHKARKYYAFLLPAGLKKGPMDMVCLDLDTAKILSHPTVTDRPWSIEYYPNDN